MRCRCTAGWTSAPPSHRWHDRVAVPHHCLDLVDAADEFTVTDFADEARLAIATIEAREQSRRARGRHRFVSAQRDRPDGGARPMARRARRVDGPRRARRRRERCTISSSTLDPVAASKMEPTNARRVVRALEVTLGSGRPFSSFGPGVDVYPTIPFQQFGLRWPRPVLTERIAERVHRMIDGGLVAEVQSPGRRADLADRTPGVGVQGAVRPSRRQHARSTRRSQTIILRTRQFAVRQERWFRRDPRIRWIDIDNDPVAEALPVLERAWQSSN